MKGRVAIKICESLNVSIDSKVSIDGYEVDIDSTTMCGGVTEIKGALKQKSRTKTKLKPADYSSVSSAIAAHETGVKFVRLLPDGSTEDLSWFALCECYANGYKIKVVEEFEIDERQEFIDTYASLRHEFHGQRTYDDFSGFMYDSGKFKLVDSND